MSGAEFYREFKDVLGYLGVSWGQMCAITVYVEGDALCFAFGGRTVTVGLPKP